MSQYQTGLVDVTSGSATVSGTGTVWTTNVTVGDLFTVTGVTTHYEVASIPTDTSLVLNSTWAGTSLTGQTYQITRDFTPVYDFPEVSQGDRSWAFNLTLALRMIDAALETVGAESAYSIEDHAGETSVTLTVSDLNKIHSFSTVTTKCVVYLPSISANYSGYWMKGLKRGAGEVEFVAADSDTIMDSNTKVSNGYPAETSSFIELFVETSTHWGCGGLLGRWSTST